MNRIESFPSGIGGVRRSLASTKLGIMVLPSLLLASHAFAAGNTLGGRLQAASGDLTTGGGWLLQLAGYILGGAAIIMGFYTLWQHTKNPNGQARLGYGLMGLIIGGAFLSASLWGSFASNTIAGANVTNTGTAQQMTFQ